MTSGDCVLTFVAVVVYMTDDGAVSRPARHEQESNRARQDALEDEEFLPGL